MALEERRMTAFRDKVEASQASWRCVVAAAAVNGVPVPAFMTALAYFD